MRMLIMTTDLIHLVKGKDFLVSGERGKSGVKATGTPPARVSSRRVGFKLLSTDLDSAAGSSILALTLIVFHWIGCSKDVGFLNERFSRICG
jgi:hypothetical protein